MTLIKVSVPVARSPRVQQVESLFDVPQASTSARSWNVDLPLAEREWSVGLIVGPSGSGKSTIARHYWPHVDEQPPWRPGQAIVDGFPEDMSIKEVTQLLSSVGLGSVPAWLRPHQVLSVGEQFRANVARTLASGADPLVIDEFTSVVDRQVGRVASYAVAKTVRRRGQRLVAVTCHEDVEDWLAPDWVLRTDTTAFAWRSKRQRPPISLDIGPISPKAWKLFGNYHYLSAGLPGGMIGCYGAWVGDTCVAFAYVCKFPHPKVRDIVRARRQVVLPDWQGLGVAARFIDWIADMYTAKGYRFRSVTLHPGRLAYYAKSPNWVYIGRGQPRLQVGPRSRMRAHQLDTRGLQLQTYQYKSLAGSPARREGPV